jgi:hypothetical protein
MSSDSEFSDDEDTDHSDINESETWLIQLISVMTEHFRGKYHSK